MLWQECFCSWVLHVSVCSRFPVIRGVVSLAFDGAAYSGSRVWSESHSKPSFTLVFSWEVQHPGDPWSDSPCEVASVWLNSDSQKLPCSGAEVHVSSLEVVEVSEPAYSWLLIVLSQGNLIVARCALMTLLLMWKRCSMMAGRLQTKLQTNYAPVAGLHCVGSELRLLLQLAGGFAVALP